MQTTEIHAPQWDQLATQILVLIANADTTVDMAEQALLIALMRLVGPYAYAGTLMAASRSE